MYYRILIEEERVIIYGYVHMKKDVKKSFPDLKELEGYIKEIINTTQQRPAYLWDNFEFMRKVFYRLSFPKRDIHSEECVLKNDMEKYDNLIERFEEVHNVFFQMVTYLDEEKDVPVKEKMLDFTKKIIQDLREKREPVKEFLKIDISEKGLKVAKESSKRSKRAIKISIILPIVIGILTILSSILIALYINP